MDITRDPIQQLADHIKNNLKKGYTSDSLRFSLMNQGYSRISVDKAIEKANKQLADLAPEMKEKPQISYNVIKDEDLKQSLKTYEQKKGFFRRLLGL